MTREPGIPRVLHIHGTLAKDDPQAARCVRLIEAFGGRLRHTLVAGDGDFGALDGITRGIAIERRAEFPPLGGVPLPGRLQRIAREMIDYHLVLTYGRGGIGAALAHTAFHEVHPLPPLVHHEDGSDESTAARRGLWSRWLRRIGLGKSAGVVVPNETMEEVALGAWQQPLGRVKLIRDGADPKRFGREPKTGGIGRLLKRSGEHWIGCFARHDGSEKLPALIAAVADTDDSWHVVIAGEGPQRAEVEAAAARLALDHRVHFVPTAAAADRAAAIALFDILAAPGGAEPLPLSVIEAMMAGKPVVGLDFAEGDASLSTENAALDGNGLRQLVESPELRRAIGAANRTRADAEYGEAAMIASYRRLYASAMGRETI